MTIFVHQTQIHMIKMIHSGWAYVTLLILIFAVYNVVSGLVSKRDFKDRDLRISLFTLIIAHFQLIIGILAYFFSAQFQFLRDKGMGEAMQQSEIRYFIIEHPLMMILAIVLITMGFSKHKRKTTSPEKFKVLAIYYGVALLFVLIRIPWSRWFTFL